MSVSFTLREEGTNWAIGTTYTNSGAVDTTAMVGGCIYAVTRELSGPGAAEVMDNPMDCLEAAPIFPRMLAMAFLTTRPEGASLTNAPVAFLAPRHAALHCYRWNLSRSAQSPYLPEQVRFELDPGLVRQVPAKAISYCFRSGFRDRSLFNSSSTVRTLPDDKFSKNAGFFMHVNRPISKCSAKF